MYDFSHLPKVLGHATAHMDALKGATAHMDALKGVTAHMDAAKLASQVHVNSIEQVQNVMQHVAQFEKTSDKIRLLAEASMPRAEIARALGIRYQHVRNVLVADEAKTKSAGKSSGNAEVEAKAAGEGAPSSLLRGKIGPAGRVVIPAAIREKLGLEEGAELVFTLEGDEMRVASMATHLKRLQQKVRALLPESANLVDELIAERRGDSGAE